MRSTYRNISILPILILILVSIFIAAPANAQTNSISVTLTPPIFQVTIGPGESWTSVLKVVNSNAYDETYYTQVVDMQANGENGQSKFTPLIATQDPALALSELARWVEIDPKPVFIKAGTSVSVPFTVRIPQNAEPGGHYAAILVGTQPMATSSTGSLMKISTYVSSLMFVRIKGEVIEAGRIREFSSDKDLYQEPKADFRLRFESTGNTHLKPQGDVTIYNMWGKERGKVLINQDANFGNVLPNSVRRFEFSWDGDKNVFDIGRYSAVVTLAYGEEGKKSVSATTYFWVVPIVPVSITLGVVILFVLILSWFIRRYVRRALSLERARLGVTETQGTHERLPIFETMIEPIREGVVDLRAASSKKTSADLSLAVGASQTDSVHSMRQFVQKYKIFFAFIAVLIICIVGMSVYFAKVLVSQRGYNIHDVTSGEEKIQEK